MSTVILTERQRLKDLDKNSRWFCADQRAKPRSDRWAANGKMAFRFAMQILQSPRLH